MTGPDYSLDETEPWALNLVLRVERDAPVAHTDLLEAAALAIVTLLSDPRAADSWAPALERWHDGRIRKLCRRARGTRWDATDALEHVEVTHASATVRAFVPTPVNAQPPELHRLQMSALDLSDPSPPAAPPPGALIIWLNPALVMTSAKAAVQAAHAAQLLYERDPGAWLVGRSLCVRTAPDDLFVTLSTTPGAVVIHDAGFTEVAPGSLTALVCSQRDPTGPLTHP